MDHVHTRIDEIRSRFVPPPAPPAVDTTRSGEFTDLLQSALSMGGSPFTRPTALPGIGMPTIGGLGIGIDGASAGCSCGRVHASSGSGAITGAVPEAGAPFVPLFEQAGARYGIDPALLAAVAWTESGFRPDAVSSAGALGLMQIMPGTAAHLGVDPRDPAQAVDGAARYLRAQLDAFGGDTTLALAAYNAGPGAVRQHGGVPPYAETMAYVQKVAARHRQLGGL